MKTLKLDSNNNIVFGTDFALLEGKEALAQDIRNLLLMWQGEFPFDTEKGIAYYDLLSRRDVGLIENTIRERISEDSRVNSVDSIEITQKDGIMSISATINSIYGAINV